MRSLAGSLAFLSLLAIAPLGAQAITPQGDFGSQPTMTFGGSGIPNDWVLTNANASTLGITLGLAAHARYVGPLPNDGVGTFFAQPGVDPNPPSPGDPYATWNWDWFIGGPNVGNYAYRFYYDFNPAAGNDRSDHGQALFPSGFFTGTAQNSFNNGMNILPPASYGSFDPNAPGQYTFLIEALDANGASVASVAMGVDVVPEPATMTLLATGLVGIAGARRRKRRR